MCARFVFRDDDLIRYDTLVPCDSVCRCCAVKHIQKERFVAFSNLKDLFLLSLPFLVILLVS